jgi:hypothetical protein
MSLILNLAVGESVSLHSIVIPALVTAISGNAFGLGRHQTLSSENANSFWMSMDNH